MTLPAGQPRTRFHTRQFLYECYRREDGLWDIDCELRDIKDHPYTLHTGTVPAKQPIHNMQIRVTVDEGLTIRDFVAMTLHAPFPDCMQAGDPMRAMIGVRIGPGWRGEIERRIGGVKGCTHLRDLLFNAATAAFQSVAAHATQQRLLDPGAAAHQGETPHFLGKCMSWALDSAVVKQYEPMFYVPKTSPTPADN